jgi:uncharacterized membrane protein
MNRWQFAIVSITVLAGSGARAAEPTSHDRDIGTEVRQVFSLKCAGCHGPDLPKPRGRFGYVLDLRRVAANPEMVIPGQPTESELWELVRRNEMPPPDSPHGPLTSDEKLTVRDWIAAGAPDASALSLNSVPSEPVADVTTAITPAERLVRWLGKFHLLLLHFPIALVVAAGAAEVWSVWRRSPRPSEWLRFSLWLAALAVIPTAALGWLFAAAGNGIASPQLLTAHRWLGTSTAVWLVLTALCAERDARRGARSRIVHIVLAVGILITALTAHLGGLLAHGEDFFQY